ncbi:MAG: hypothetical protein ABIP55_10035, partial [Tepidisphaeraceae bacterium]
MPSELLAELIIKPLFGFLFYWTGKPIVRVLSLGQLHVAMVDPDARGKRQRRWYSCTFTLGGKRYLDAEWVMVIGFVFWALVVAAIVLVVRR